MYSIVLCALISSVSVLDQKPVYDNPLAYVRSPELGLSINRTNYKGTNIEYLEGIIGKAVPIVTASLSEVKLQLGLEASAWLALGYDEGAFPMLTQDFYFSVPLYLRYNSISGAIKFNHISSHQGDGMDILVEKSVPPEKEKQIEEIEKQDNVNISLVQPISYSRDFVSADIAYEYKILEMNAKSYVEVGYVHKMIPDELKRWFVGSGTEFRLETQYVNPYYAQDIRYNQDTDSIDYSGQLGIISLSSRLFEARLALTGYLGKDRRGQFVGHKLKQVGIGVFIR